MATIAVFIALGWQRLRRPARPPEQASASRQLKGERRHQGQGPQRKAITAAKVAQRQPSTGAQIDLSSALRHGPPQPKAPRAPLRALLAQRPHGRLLSSGNDFDPRPLLLTPIQIPKLPTSKPQLRTALPREASCLLRWSSLLGPKGALRLGTGLGPPPQHQFTDVLYSAPPHE